ncbi:C40 family peptidase [Bacillus sp. RG28]|uniref:C40 family peptidase n=1 Tax=Gottfriedia endophytica TaxID=2820819 RepID=A0A940SIB9_9BACI|nr:C40 family peptidase [Gottfriedia endophytica]MBP0727127.1 C40 family peptidase [Gottfriedia endophytica]
MFSKKIISLTLAGVLLASAPITSVNAASKKVETKQAEVNKYQNQLTDLSNQVKNIDNQINDTEKQISDKKDEIAKTEKTIKDKNDRITYLQGRITKRNNIIKERLQKMQEQPRSNLVTEVLFNSSSIMDFFSRISSINTLFQADQNIIDDQKTEQAEVVKEKQSIKDKQDTLVAAKQDLVNKQNDLANSQKEKQQAMNQATNQLKQAVAELQAAKEDATRLEQESLRLAELQDASSPSDSSQPTGPVASGNSIVDYAMQFTGVPYVFGGTTPSGFDCSGFIWYVYSHTGHSIARGNVATYWNQVTKVSSPEPGDLVFLKDTYISGPSHMGIYIGGNQMIHAGSKGIGTVSLSSGFVRSHFLGYGRF